MAYSQAMVCAVLVCAKFIGIAVTDCPDCRLAHGSSCILSFFSKAYITFVLSYSIPFFIVNLLLPVYRSAKESRRNKTELQRLKHNPQIFNALLAKQKAVAESTDGLGITIGNPDALYKIIKVCNPYCGPCAKAHRPIEELVDNNPDVQVQIIFTATNDEQDSRTAPVRHLLAIAEQNNEQIIKQALDNWYLAEQL